MSKINIFCLGGASEVGRSCVIIEDGESSVMFDSGIHPAYMGIGCLPIYDAYDISKVDLCLITHFHMDHSGALPYLINKTRFKGRVFMTEATKSICYLLWNDYSRLEKCMNVIQRNKKKDVYSKKGKTYRGNGIEDEIWKKNYLYSSDEEKQSEDEFFHSNVDILYDEADIERTMDVIETLNFHQNLEHKSIKFTAYRAGHVLGACMFLVELNNIRFLYTGDYSREIDRHIPIAEIPSVDVHVLICEGTYGIRIHDDRREREKHFLEMVTNIVNNRGKVLLPVFALGRAQELLLILEEHWEYNNNLKHIPIFYISSMAIKSLSVYETFINLCGDYVKNIAKKGKNPFNFQYVKYIKSLDDILPYLYKDGCPCVIMAAPGMLQNGISKNVFNIIAPDKKNGVILTGYTVRGTLADELKREPDFITVNDRVVRRRCSFDQISFSAHSDFNQTKSFIEKLKCPNVVLVHGDKYELNRLKGKLMEEKSYLAVFAPEILQKLTFNFEQNDTVVAVGKLAKEINQVNQLSEEMMLRKKEKTHENKNMNEIVENQNDENKENDEIILKKRTEEEWENIEQFLEKKKKEPIEALIFADTHKTPLILYPEDINEYTNLKYALIDQSININYPYRFNLLYDMLTAIYEDTYMKNENNITVKEVKINYDKNNKIITINWLSSPINDLVADSINFLILEFLQTMNVKKKVQITEVADERTLYEFICVFVEENYSNVKKISKDELKKYVLQKSQLENTEKKSQTEQNQEDSKLDQNSSENKMKTIIETFFNEKNILKYIESESCFENVDGEINELLRFEARDKLNHIVTVYVDIDKREVICESDYMLQKIKEILRNLEEAVFPIYF